MKARFFLLLFVSTVFVSIAQEPINESVKPENDKVNSLNQKSVRDFKRGEVVIPMVFHIVHGNGIENVTDGQIMEAINQLNEDYNAQTAGIEDVIPEFKDIVADIGVKFALARKDPEGNSTSGIIRYYSPNETTQINGNELPMKDKYRWPVGKYLNIYVLSSAGMEAGSAWAHGPMQDEKYDGVVISYWALGRTEAATPTHIKILTHEIGHWFDLAHTFGGNCDKDKDGIEDTPPCTVGRGCVLYDTVCGGLVNRQNFMDYTRCQLMFTEGQKEVMLNVLDSSANGRNKIWRLENQIATGVKGEPVSASFYSSQIMTVPGDTIKFNDVSVSEKGDITEWEWEFPGGIPSSFTGKTPPPVVYNDYGKCDVKLTVVNANGDSDFELKKKYINVHTDIYMQNADFTVAGGKFYDTGYKQRYSSRTDRKLVLRPKEEGKVVQVLFNLFEMEKDTLDFLDIYNGPDTNSVLIGKYWGIKGPGVVTSTHPSGALTFVSHSNVEFRYQGWEADILVVNEEYAPRARFVSDKNIICIGDEIQFTNMSAGINKIVSWKFEGGTPATSTEKNPIVRYDNKGKFKVVLDINNKSGESSNIEDEYVSVGMGFGMPYFQGFEKVFPPKDWVVNNPDGGHKWNVSKASGNKSASSMVMDNSDNSIVGEIDEITFPLDLSSMQEISMSFDLAYTKFDNKSEDILMLFVSIDCGATWKRLYKKNHKKLETTVIAQDDSNGWIPEKESDWRQENIKLGKYAGESHVLIKFQNTSGYGTKIWIDNIKVE